MPISPPVPKDTRSRLADWIEVECLVSPNGVPASRVRRLWAGLDESGHDEESDPDSDEVLETEILEEEPATCESDVGEEMEWRSRVLGPLYPFRLKTLPTNWMLKCAANDQDESIQTGRSFYLFCLLVSALRDDRIRDDTAEDLTKQAERDFEHVATTAGAGLCGGEAIAFGWPREDGTPFRAALEKVGDRLGWKPRRDKPPWSSAQEKDVGVDVIAWRDFGDHGPGRLLLLGQAASGSGWEKKGLESSGLFNWFEEIPAKHYLPALFTPFPQHHGCMGRRGEDFRELSRAQAWKREQMCGLVLDRLRIVEMAADHLARNGLSETPPTLQRLEEWVRRACEAAEG